MASFFFISRQQSQVICDTTIAGMCDKVSTPSQIIRKREQPKT